MSNNQEPGTATTESTPLPVIYGMIPEQPSDEISLIELFLVITRRKKIVFFTTLIFIVLSTAFALQKKDVYRYAATIEIGSRLVNEEIINIDSPATVLAKLVEGYIPLVLFEYANKRTSNDTGIPKITGHIPKGSEIIVIEIKGGKKQEDTYIQLLNRVIEKIEKSHKLIISGMRKSIENDINKVSRKVLAKETELSLQRAMLKRQDEVAELINHEIKNTNTLLVSALKSKEEALRETSEESKAITVMLLNSEIRNTQEIVAKLKERLHVTLPGIKDNMNKKIQDIQGSIEGLHDEESKLILEKSSIKYTRAMTPPMRSLKPTGSKLSLIVMLGAIAGLFFGIIFVFVAEFLKKVREVEVKVALS